MKEDEEDASGEGRGALKFLATGEEEEGLLRADDQGKADEEEDLDAGG